MTGSVWTLFQNLVYSEPRTRAGICKLICEIICEIIKV